LEIEMNRPKYLRVFQGACALVAILFGLATLFAGVRVLGGADPGYVVFMPLLIFNTAMGLLYVGAGVMAWYSLDRGKYAAGGLFVVNLLVLVIIGYLHWRGTDVADVAMDSVYAMTLRTGVWLVLFAGLAWLARRVAAEQGKRDEF
jgi:hypothetical protein